MDKAKAAVDTFLNKSGHHDTTVHENIAPAVTNENVTPTRHEHATTAVDREIHQDHHHTSVQPIQHREVLPEKHTHNVGAVEERHHKHGNDSDVTARLEQERAQFKDQRVVGETKHTASTAPTVTGEHVHHHVHETIQPVIHKETVQPHIVHTTIPIHEVHENEAKHHTASHLPAMSLADFEKQGGSLSGRGERTDNFNGEPKGVGSALGGSQHQSTTGNNTIGTDGASSRDASGSTNTTSGLGSKTGSGVTGHHQRDSGFADGNSGSGYDNTTSGGMTNTTGTTGTKKPSLMDKLNPKVDSNGDGQAGFMK